MRDDKRKLKDLINSVLESESDTNKYYEFGVKTFGPFLYGYINWLNNKLKENNYSKVFFFSRDGYMMEKAFREISDNNISYEYVYFSRNSLRQALLCKCGNYIESLRYLTWERFVSFAKLLNYYGFNDEEKNEISKLYNIELNKDFSFDELPNNKKLNEIYNDLKDKIDKYSKEQSELLAKYLKQIGLTGKVAIVDIGWHGSMQFFLEEFIKEERLDAIVDGYYLGIKPSCNLTGKTFGYLYNADNLKLRKSVLCFLGGYEKLFQSIEGSTLKYEIFLNGGGGIIVPLLDYYEYADDPKSIEHIKDWQRGAIEFVKAARDSGIIFSDKALTSNLINMGKSPKLNQIYLFKFLYNIDGVKTYYVSQKPLYKYTPSELIHDLSNSVWKTGFMKSVFKLPFPYYWIYEVLRK